MLAFFRRALSSWLAVGLLALIMVAFIVTGVGTPGGGLIGGPGSDAVAVVGGKPITTQAVADRAESALRQARQQQPSITMPQFLDAIGGLEPFVQQYVTAAVLTGWAEKHGLVASEPLIGGEIASIPAFKGPTGKFDENVMQGILSQRRMTFARLHDDVRDELLRRQLLGPILVGVRAPDGLLRTYAQGVIDRREGVIGLVGIKPDSLAAPTEQEVTAYYKSHIAAYSLPERRSLRYALIEPDTVQVGAPSEAEIAAQYKADAAKYGASETRTIQRVVLPDENAARSFSAKLTKGVGFAQAASEAGLAAADIAVGPVTRDAFAASDGKALADAAFALPGKGDTAPVKSALGWAIAHVDAVTRTAARSLEQARPEIVTALTTRKATDTLAKTVEQAQDAISDGATFGEVAARLKLQVVTTPPLLPNGTAPTVPGYTPDPNVQALLKAAGDATPDDEPTVETIDQAHFALLGVAGVTPAAPLPLAEVRARVAQDLQLQRATAQSRTIAQGLLAKVNGGQPLAAAFADAKQEAPKPIALSQLELSRAGQNVPGPIRALFRLAPGKSELVRGPNGSWFVVQLQRITPGDPKLLPLVMGGTRNELQRSLGDEYIQQFSAAARGDIKVKRNATALAALNQQLRGGQ